uniref:Uncharacterized protein n=1 Tax=Plectus sambesii TaxID=2011161 RepID=A0A914UTG3_9BILA
MQVSYCRGAETSCDRQHEQMTADKSPRAAWKMKTGQGTRRSPHHEHLHFNKIATKMSERGRPSGGGPRGAADYRRDDRGSVRDGRDERSRRDDARRGDHGDNRYYSFLVDSCD